MVAKRCWALATTCARLSVQHEHVQVQVLAVGIWPFRLPQSSNNHRGWKHPSCWQWKVDNLPHLADWDNTPHSCLAQMQFVTTFSCAVMPLFMILFLLLTILFAQISFILKFFSLSPCPLEVRKKKFQETFESNWRRAVVKMTSSVTSANCCTMPQQCLWCFECVLSRHFVGSVTTEMQQWLR